MDKAYISLISVCIGWSLSQLTDFFKNKRKKSKIENAVKSEISDVAVIIFDARNSALKSAITYGKKRIYAFNLSAKIDLPITEKYYTEIFSLFNECQRQNYRMLIKHLSMYNKAFEFFENGKSATQNEIIIKLFTAYKHLAFAFVFINSLSSDEMIDDHHPKLVALRKHFERQTSKLSLKVAAN